MPTFGSLFAGIGGMDLGLERAGWECRWQVELDPWCRAVLERHWPDVPRFPDVRGFQPPERVDLIAGGFPCQPFSLAGRRHGVADDRWGWPWMEGVVRMARPRFVLVENVADLVRDSEAWGWVLGDLAGLGMDAEWGVLPACAFGAPHTRDRVFLVADSDSGDGPTRLGAGAEGPRPIPSVDHRARAWRDLVDGAVETSRTDDREADGSARRMVEAGGNATVPDIAEWIGRRLLDA